MTIKTLLLFVFLYICLVWVGAALYFPDTMRDFGLRWTFIGIAVVLAWLLLARIWGWMRLARAKRADAPKAAAKPAGAASLHEDDAALLALLAEANNTLAGSSGSSPKGNTISAFPVYLLVGPENSGKTGTLLNSGLEPTPLAGQATGAGQTIPTKLANIWLAKNVIFIELGGRAFAADLARWVSLLHVLHGQRTVPVWRRLVSEADHGLDVRGVIAFCELKDFTITASRQGKEILDRSSRHWRERLGAIAEIFGRQLPVYLVTTKAEIAIPYFGDYFARMRDPEINQIFGCTLPPIATNDPAFDGSAVAEDKRLTKSFSPLLHRLAELRLVMLAHEPDPARKPGVYEFPRELRRLRPSYVQFLVEVFRPHPLRFTPFLRGYYFTGVREDDTAAASGPVGPTLADQSVSDATAFFRGDATQIFKGHEPARPPVAASRGPLRRRWLFVSDLFANVILRDQPKHVAAVQSSARLELYRKIAVAAVCALCLLLGAAFVRSWTLNSNMLDSLNGRTNPPVHTRPASMADLESLDRLRTQTAQLLDYDRNGPPLSFRWGLYAGGQLAPAARDLYFHRFREVLLNDLNATLTNGLKALPDTPGANDAYQPVAEIVKAHLMISSGACKPNTTFILRLLRESLAQATPAVSLDWRTLAERQIEFYATELPFGNPAQLAEDTAAVDHARNYLHNIQGTERIYAAMLAQAEKAVSPRQRLADIAPNYAEVLRGPAEVKGVYSREGWLAFLKATKDVRSVDSGEACVVGSNNPVSELSQTLELEHSLQNRFVQDYIAEWQTFVKGFSIAGYAGAGDAARKLQILADHRSPLLGLLAMTSKQTSFPNIPQPAAVQKAKSAINNIIGAVQGTPAAREPTPDSKSFDPTSQIARAFQPVQAVVPAASDTWITPANNPYVEALSQLGASLQQIAAARLDADPAIFQAAKQNYDKALDAARQLSRGFDPIGVNGLDSKVQTLLTDPITSVDRYIPKDTTKIPINKLNGEARAFCSSVEPILRKYPFQESSQDVSFDELTRMFAPGGGEIWKFQAKSLAESTFKEGTQWKAKDGAKLPVLPAVTVFLNRAQAITDAFFPAGSTQPHLTYTLRPKLDENLKGSTVALTVDGQAHEWKSSLQKQFVWPAPPGLEAGARAFLNTGNVSFPFASRGGLWGVFRMIGDAEPRLLGSRIVEWKYVRGGEGGRREPIQPAPVRLDFVEFPGGADVFNPKFFDGLHCPKTAASAQ